MRQLLALFLPGLLVFAALEAFSKTQASWRVSREWKDGSCGFVQNIYNQRLSWKNNFPIPLQIHNSVPDSMKAAIYRATQVWEKAMGQKVFTITETHKLGSKDLAQMKDKTNTIYWYNPGEWTGEKDDQARTVISWNGSQITQANMLINSDSFRFYVDRASTGFEIDLESVVIHELGHVLGLKHNDHREGIMATYLKENLQRREIFEEDVNALRCEYGS